MDTSTGVSNASPCGVSEITLDRLAPGLPSGRRRPLSARSSPTCRNKERRSQPLFFRCDRGGPYGRPSP
eukprot:127200-Pyramimonas_sp.AAC.1